MRFVKSTLLVAALAFVVPSAADVILLDFEGPENLALVGDYYNGGRGTNYGVSFSGAALSARSKFAGGTGNFADEPSPITVLVLWDSTKPPTPEVAIMNRPAGFDTGLAFYYSATAAGTVEVWSGSDATGTQLGSVTLGTNGQTGCAGPIFCQWTALGIPFAGTAMSAKFTGVAGRWSSIGFDNMTLGAVDPIPEPSTYFLLTLGLAGVALAARRRRRSL